MNIKWKNGWRSECSATVAYRFFERIREENDGRLDLEDAVHKSKPKDAPLHNELEWNNAKCGEFYRRDQMRRIVGKLEVIRDDMNVATRVYESYKIEVVEDKKKQPAKVSHVFRKTEDILSDKVARSALLQQAIKDAIAFRRRYAALSEMARLIEVIDQEVEKFA